MGDGQCDCVGRASKGLGAGYSGGQKGTGTLHGEIYGAMSQSGALDHRSLAELVRGSEVAIPSRRSQKLQEEAFELE